MRKAIYSLLEQATYNFSFNSYYAGTFAAHQSDEEGLQQEEQEKIL